MQAEKQDSNYLTPASNFAGDQSGEFYRCSRTAEHFLLVGPMLGSCRPDDDGAFQPFTSQKTKQNTKSVHISIMKHVDVFQDDECISVADLGRYV